jgi:hypothetical protein
MDSLLTRWIGVAAAGNWAKKIKMQLPRQQE